MRYVFLLFLAGCTAQQAHFVDRGLFNNSPFVTAKGATPDQARDRAMAAMPPDFEPDPAFRGVVLSCGGAGEAPVPDGPVNPPKCPSGLYRVDIGLLPRSGAEREAILKTREQGFAALEKDAVAQ